jgi:hypothetical protein
MDSLTWGIAASFAAQEGIKFLFGQLTELISRARSKQSEAVESRPPATAFETPPDRIRLSAKDLVGHETAAERLAEDIGTFLKSHPSADEPNESALLAIRDLRALMESLSGQQLTFAGEGSRNRPIAHVEASIKRVEGRLVGIDATRDTSGRDHRLTAEIDEVTRTGDVTLFKA